MSASCTAVQRQTLLDLELAVRYLPLSMILNHQLAEIAGQVTVFTGGKKSLLSPAYMIRPRPICRLLLMQAIPLAFSLALASAGSNIAARMAMMAMTTSSSISVKPDLGACWWRSGKNAGAICSFLIFMLILGLRPKASLPPAFGRGLNYPAIEFALGRSDGPP